MALEVATRASCAAIAIGFLEQLWIVDRIYGRVGLYALSVTRLIGSARITNRLGPSALRLILAGGTLAGGLGMIAGPFAPLGRIAIAVTLLVAIILRLRRVMGGDGADQMAILTLFAACVAVLPGVEERATALAAYLIGAQLVLSYLTAGVVKAVSPVWRDGSALGMVLGSEAYGQPWAAALAERHPQVSRGLAQAVVVWECLFPLILVGPEGFAVAMLAVGLLFHATCAVVMGLNTFVIAFPATYLCVMFLAQNLSPFW